MLDDSFKARLHKLYYDEIYRVQDDLDVFNNALSDISNSSALSQAENAQRTIKDIKLQIIKRERYLNVLKSLDKGVDLMVVGPILDREEKEVHLDDEDD